jgi:hypothetical protein
LCAAAYHRTLTCSFLLLLLLLLLQFQGGEMCQILTQPQAAAAEIKKKFAARDENKNVQSFSLLHG